jgi:hypothetical protein
VPRQSTYRAQPPGAPCVRRSTTPSSSCAPRAAPTTAASANAAGACSACAAAASAAARRAVASGASAHANRALAQHSQHGGCVGLGNAGHLHHGLERGEEE